MKWIAKANCKGQTALFFAPDNERPPSRNRRVAQALALCAACPVASDCVDAKGDNVGIWGGVA